MLESKISSGDAVRPVLGGTRNKFRGRRIYPRTAENPLGGAVTAETQPCAER